MDSPFEDGSIALGSDASLSCGVGAAEHLYSGDECRTVLHAAHAEGCASRREGLVERFPWELSGSDIFPRS